MDTVNTGYGLIGAYAFVYLGIAISTSFYWHRVNRALTMVRGCLVASIYRKTAEISITFLNNSAALTLMSIDAARITNGLQLFHEYWANTVQIGVATYLLERELGWACVAPLLVAAASVAGTMSVANPSRKHQGIWMRSIQKRIGTISSTLSAMKGVKMAGLTERIQNSLQNLRANELDSASQYRSLVNYTAVISFIPQLLSPAITFAVFVAITAATERTLDTSKMFTTLSLLTLLSQPLAELFMSVPALMGALNCCERVQTFLLSDTKSDHRILIRTTDTIDDDRQSDNSTSVLIQNGGRGLADISERHTGAITVHEGSFGWKLSEPPILSNLNFSIPPSKLVMIIGPVASGKSTLLKALLGETPSFSGSVSISESEIAFCDRASIAVSFVDSISNETPWLINGTIQNNILGFDNFDSVWYGSVVHACDLDEDLSILPIGDKSLIGSKGITLSGGQKQRIAIARAVYSKKSIMIFDDVFSGLDASTEELVFNRLLGSKGLLRKMGTTVIVATLAVNLLPSADLVIALGQNGDIVEQGTFEQLNKNSGYVQFFFIKESHAKKDTSVSINKHSLGKKQTIIEPTADKSRQTGDVRVYKFYFQKLGPLNTFLFLFFALMFVFFSTFPSIWVKWWSDSNDVHPNQRNGYYLGVYSAFSVMSLISIFLLGWHVLTTMIAKSGLDLHLVILRSVMNAPMSFFSSIDTGVTVNRFSQDMQIIDGELPFGLMRVAASLFTVVGQALLIATASPYIAVTFPFIAAVFYFVQKYYLRTSRQLRFMDLESKSPLYTQFIESLAGLATLRAFNWQEPSRELNLELLDISQKPFYLLKMIQQWLSLVLNLVSMGLAVVVVSLAVGLRDSVSPGLAGVSLLNIISFSQNLNGLVSFWTMLETSIGAVSRIKTFQDEMKSENLPDENAEPSAKWPESGEIQFRNVSAAYKATDKDALSNFTLTIKPGEKIGICGRSGSGKSSLILTLFRLLDFHSGNILIDSLPISTIPRSLIRTRLISIPQDPYFLSESIRVNFDPYSQSTDSEIITALTKVRLDFLVEDLEKEFEEGQLSHGQRQLFCLARAMLRKGSIVVLDEATSSVDRETDALMQKLIREEFEERTVVAVAHRLEGILDFDRVVVLDKGKLVECGPPGELLVKGGGIFRGLVERGSSGEGSREVGLEGNRNN